MSAYTVLYFIYFMACKELYIYMHFIHIPPPLPYCLFSGRAQFEN